MQKKHDSFNECCIDAMDLDDNFDESGDSMSEHSRLEGRALQSTSNNHTPGKEVNQDHLVETILRRLGQTYRPPQRQTWNSAPQTTGPYRCGICAQPHRTEDCPSYMPGANSQAQRKWCQVCKWNLTHGSQECMHIARLAREREAAVQMQSQPRQGYAQPTEQARPVLGVQPPAPGTIPVRYADTEYQEAGREFVTSNPFLRRAES